MPCTVTTKWCNAVTECTAKLVADGDSFIDPPQSALSPSQGSPLNPAPPAGSPITEVDWIFEDGQWRHFSWFPLSNSYFYGNSQSATRIQPTKVEKTCTTYSVCYESVDECPGGSPPGTAPSNTFDNQSSWENQAQNAANGHAGTTDSLPTLPIDLGVDATTSSKNGSSVPGSTNPVGYQNNGAVADCVNFANATEVSSTPIGSPSVTTSDGPALEALN